MIKRVVGLNYRDNVGMVVKNADGLVLCGERLNYSNHWQLPQGGVDSGEDIKKAMFRELKEETGLKKKQVQLINQTKDWLYYETPKPIKRSGVMYHGQRQIWFLLKLNQSNPSVSLDKMTKRRHPEFTRFQWIKFKDLLNQVVEFRKSVYQEVYQQFKAEL